MKKFYMIYVEDGNLPTFKHWSEESAIKEAKRLAEHTGKKAYVLLAITSVELPDKFKIEHVDSGELPF